MQMLVPSYLEFTIDKLTTDQHKFREQFEAALGNSPLAVPTRQMFGSLEEQTRKNMALFNQALTMFTPFGAPKRTSDTEASEASEDSGKADLDNMKRQLDELQKRLEQLVPKE
jgi:polyhydroxyalkanoate synthesis regulator protein